MWSNTERETPERATPGDDIMKPNLIELRSDGVESTQSESITDGEKSEHDIP